MMLARAPHLPPLPGHAVDRVLRSFNLDLVTVFCADLLRVSS